MKKIISFALALIMLCTLTAGIDFSAFADNDSFSNAKNLSVNTAYSGNVTGGYDDDKNYYKFTTTSAGYVTVNFSNSLQSNSDNYWNVYFYNSSYEELCSTSIAGNKSSTNLTTMGLAAGTYYIMICSSSWYEACSTNFYNIKVNFTSNNYWEKEFNENFSTSNKIAVNTTYKGTIRKGNDDEKDYYKFTTTSAGYVTVNFSNSLQSNSDNYWNVYLYNSSYEELCSASIAGNKSSTNLTTMGLTAGTYYIMVCSSNWYEASSTGIYSLKANFTSNNYWEKEFNDNYTTANSISIGSTYCGTVRSGSDNEKDYYKFTSSSSDNYKVSISTPKTESSDVYWKLYVYDSSYKEILNLDVTGNTGGASSALSLSSGTYYVMVCSSSWYEACSTGTYKIKVEYSVSSPYDLKASGATTSSTKLSWSAVSNAAGYQVQQYKSNTWKTLTTTSSKSYKVKSLSSGKSYKFRVRAYRNVSGQKVYGSWVTITTGTKPGSTSISKISAKSKGFKVTWKKKSSVTGYQVQYATNKKFTKNKKTVTVKKNTTTSKTIKSLKAKKKYYVRVRTYKTVSGKKYYSSWSKVKTVTTKK